MLKILLNVIGTHHIDMQRDKIEFTTVGELEETDNCYIVRYKEEQEQEQPAPPVDVCVKINKDESRAEMIRNNGDGFIIEKSKRNMCRYGTEYGDILMGISGHYIDTEFNGESGEFSLGYDIDVNGALVSKNEVKLIFRKN